MGIISRSIVATVFAKIPNYAPPEKRGVCIVSQDVQVVTDASLAKMDSQETVQMPDALLVGY